MVQNVRNLAKMVKNCPNLAKMVQNVEFCTVWKLETFSATVSLREIKIGKFRVSKDASFESYMISEFCFW